MGSTSSIQIRRATEQDCRFVWETNNHRSVREQSINTDSIAWDDHRRWYRAALNSDERRLWLAELDDEPIGVVRFDLDPDTGDAEISVALAPASRGQGLGTRLIADSTRQICEIDQLDRVIAHIRPENPASVGAFEAAGYRPKGQDTIHGVDLLRYEFHRQDAPKS